MNDPYGYLLVHFVEDALGHAEKVYFSLSEGDDPLCWRRLRSGEPVLESTAGTTGVRDPFVVRRQDSTGFHVLATDLRVWREGGPDWDEFTRHGSRDLVVWDSPDLLTWSAPRFVTVAPPTFGMAWAPTVAYDEAAGQYRVFFSGTVFDDPGHEGTAASAVHEVRTSDFVAFTPPREYLRLPTGVIDLVAVPSGDTVHVLAKHDDADPDSWQVFQQERHGFDDPAPRLVARRVGAHLSDRLEGPLLFREHGGARWHLWLDDYASVPQGFRAFTCDDPASGAWESVPLVMPAATKHGCVLPLDRAEWEQLSGW